MSKEKECSTAHYDSMNLGEYRLDPYQVSLAWQLGKKDDTGGLFHILKNISRFGEKNEKKRELQAIVFTATRMLELLEQESI